MKGRNTAVDKVRASRDGHEYHEAWTARRALQLLWPDSELTAIAIEGLSPQDQTNALAATVEVADITLYYGSKTDFAGAKKTTISQFKYSIAKKDKDFRASDAKKTIEKFGKTYRQYKKTFGARAVEEKLNFELVTNQSISKSLLQAVHALGIGKTCDSDAKRQAKQFADASGLTGRPLAQFARKVNIVGGTGELRGIKDDVESCLVDWSAANDALAAARLGSLRALVREKAGHAGTHRNLIRHTDILAALQISDLQDLLPCEPRTPDIGRVLEREQLEDAIAFISQATIPLVVKATGGVGKTVFLETLATKLGSSHEVVFFDCFGGGAYRSPQDGRHLPQKGLIHIANMFAFRGLCDPMLPGNADMQGLFRTFRRRLSQCLETLRRLGRKSDIVLIIDAIDNANIVAQQRSEDCFPVKLLESLYAEPICGVTLVVACRSERIPITDAAFDEFELCAFSKEETESFLRTRLKRISDVEVNVAQARSGGNPRVLDYLITEGRRLLDESEIDKEIQLDDLLQNRITRALAAATERGSSSVEIDTFLAGLAVLPPPVPPDEYAGAQGMSPDAIESFSSDLIPLLERTNQGIMFRDEPTETLVRERYASTPESLRHVASNLMKRQDVSVYAARALPGLLHQLGDSEQIFALAFDSRIPAPITSTFGKRAIRHARVQAATLHAALKKDANSLVQLLVELSTIAVVDQRGSDYILAYPDLVVAARDVDATRRLFESRTGWAGTRHARLAIANALSKESEESHRHAYAASQWLSHHRRTRDEDRHLEVGPVHADVAAVPTVLITEGREDRAALYLRGWRDWFVYEVCELIFGYAHLAQSIADVPSQRLNRFVDALSGAGALASALSFQELSTERRKKLVDRLARRCKRKPQVELQESYFQSRFHALQDGLRKSAAIALSLGLAKEAMTISLRAPHKRPGLWSFQDRFSDNDVFPFLFRVALRAAVKDGPVHEKDLLPRDLVPICSRISNDVTGAAFRDRAKRKLANYVKKKNVTGKKGESSRSLSYEEQQSAEQFLLYRLEPVVTLTRAFAGVLATNTRGLDRALHKLIDVWESVSKERNPYEARRTDGFLYRLGFDIVRFVVWARSDCKASSVRRFLEVIHNHEAGAASLIRVVAILAKREALKPLAGEQAISARTLIEREDDVIYRASLLGDLGRAMLPASVDEASAYFRAGLEQMDAIGSGDNVFINELLVLASRMTGNELDEPIFHTLSNICELNMGEEPEKFSWGAYGQGMSRVAGIRGLAKLSRWSDRDKISLNNTLLPYLTGLIECGKIGPKDALALNRLAEPVEYYFASTKEFANSVRQAAGADSVVASEMVEQYLDDNPDWGSEGTVDALIGFASEAMGPDSDLSAFLRAARRRYVRIREAEHGASDYRDALAAQMGKDAEKEERESRKALKRIVDETDPVDERSLAKAIDKLNTLHRTYELKSSFFVSVRNKVSYDGRVKYIRNIANLENLLFYWKFEELREARKAWEDSTAALGDVYKELACLLISAHAEDLVIDDRLIDKEIADLSKMSNVPVFELIVELITIFARPDRAMSGSVWLALATRICPEAEAGQGQMALERLLTSEAASLADNVADGAWTKGLYPGNEFEEIAVGMIWRALGSPNAVDRWRGAHSLRIFTKFDRWAVIDGVVACIGRVDAGAFQAKEFSFSYMHARLWLLIVLARMAKDYPSQIARYKNELLGIVLGDGVPHVLVRKFAREVLLTCVEASGLGLSIETERRVRCATKSPYQRVRDRVRSNGGFYSDLSNNRANAQHEFLLDYDFHKEDVDRLSQVFGQSCSKVADMVREIALGIDPNAKSMYANRGRRPDRRGSSYRMNSRYHTYGQQLGWHSLFVAAGKLLRDHPVTGDSWYEDDPWKEWINGYSLTRGDGYWLSDGTDRTPPDTAELLLDRTKEERAITGNQEKILSLAGLRDGVGTRVVVEGRWFSVDKVRVLISSALVPTAKSATLARKLIEEEPMGVWVPCFDGYDEESEHIRGVKEGYTPWITCPSGGARLDEHDPYGVSIANFRPRLAQEFAALCSLSKEDAFGRVWTDRQGDPVLCAQAWGRERAASQDDAQYGTRLYCATPAMKEILEELEKDLLILINLQRYEKESYRSNPKYTHTVAVARITQNCDLSYFEGRINHTHVMRW